MSFGIISKMQSKNRHSREHKEAGREGGSWAALHHGCPAPGAVAALASFGSPAHSSQPQEALYTSTRAILNPETPLVLWESPAWGRRVAARAGAASVCWAGRPAASPGHASEAGSGPAGIFSFLGTRPGALVVGEEGEGAAVWTVPFQVFSQLHHRIVFLTTPPPPPQPPEEGGVLTAWPIVDVSTGDGFSRPGGAVRMAG